MWLKSAFGQTIAHFFLSHPQILGSLDIVIPIHQILNMFKCGVDKIGSDVADITAATAAAAAGTAEGAGASPGGNTSTGSPSMRVSHDGEEFGEHVIGSGAGNNGLFSHGHEFGYRHAVLAPGSPVREHAAPLSPERFPNLPDLCEYFEKESELVLPCFIMMLDLCLKQVCITLDLFLSIVIYLYCFLIFLVIG